MTEPLTPEEARDFAVTHGAMWPVERIIVTLNAYADQLERLKEMEAAVGEWVKKAFIAGAIEVHANYEPNKDPEFGEAADNYWAELEPRLRTLMEKK